MSEMISVYASLGINTAERVTAGAELLDAHEPGWETKVNTMVLALDHPDQCVLGQLFGSYVAGASRLGFAVEFGDEAVTHGFWLSDAEYESLSEALLTAYPDAKDTDRFIYAPLTEAWVREIDRRRDATLELEDC